MPVVDHHPADPGARSDPYPEAPRQPRAAGVLEPGIAISREQHHGHRHGDDPLEGRPALAVGRGNPQPVANQATEVAKQGPRAGETGPGHLGTHPQGATAAVPRATARVPPSTDEPVERVAGEHDIDPFDGSVATVAATSGAGSGVAQRGDEGGCPACPGTSPQPACWGS